MRDILYILLSTVVLVSCAKVEPPKAIAPVPTEQQVAWHKMENYAFVHFGLNTFNDLEWGFGDTPASTFNPTNLDPSQWIEVIKAAGLKGVIVTVKHHDGFCLWPSKYNDYNVSSSPWMGGKGDLVRELIDACRANNLKLGLYLSPWDRNHAEYGRDEYREYFQNQISELINDYCNDIELFEYWFDGANGGDGYYGGAREGRSIDAKTYYQYQKCVDIIHSKFPHAMIFGGTSPTIRWVGNEDGWAGETSWAMFDSDGDHHYTQAQYGLENGGEWLPSEVDVSIRPGWFYHKREDHQLHSLSKLVDIYYNSVGRNSNLLLNFPVSLAGTIHPLDSARIIEWRRTIDRELRDDLLKGAKVEATSDRGRGFSAESINDGDWDSYWATEDGVVSGDLIFTFDKPTELNRLLLQEYIPLGQRVKSFAVEYLDGKEWHRVPTSDSMTTVGYKRIIRFGNITTERLKVSFLDARGPLTINNIEAFCAPALLVEPTIARDSKGEVSITGGDKMAKLFYTTDGTEPTTASTQYSAPFALDRGEVKAIAVDPASAERVSGVATESFDVVTSGFKASGKGGEAMFDCNPYTNYAMTPSQRSVEITLDRSYKVKGFTYTPNQTRWGAGVIGSYELYAGGRLISKGEFSNIKANPIEQIVVLPTTVETSSLRFVATSLVDGSDKAEIAEFTLVTER